MRWIKEEGKQTGREKEEENGYRERERREKKREILSEFRRLELDDPRRKVDPRITSYAWVLKSWSIVKLYEVGNFPTLNIFSLKAM